jgi:bifunctional non-homologous end joining protein LigD
MPDALKEYKAKRNFSITSEPAEGGEASKGALTFVIQKHWATRLHYDFRLELDGTMKSWAVPKGPSYDSHDKRMAVHVEDHPISYSDFEGTIPPQQYGAGKVIVWDKGTWEPVGDPRQGYAKGEIKFEMHGHKMHGRWVLVRLRGHEDDKQEPWLLIKENDEYMRSRPRNSRWSTNAGQRQGLADARAPDGARQARTQSRRKGRDCQRETEARRDARGRRQGRAARNAHAELATLVDGPPERPGKWIFEIKFDGYRMLTRVQGKDVRLSPATATTGPTNCARCRKKSSA